MSSPLAPTFQFEEGEPRIGWDAYSMALRKQWKNLLQRQDVHEPQVQSFLEMHPCLVPVARERGQKMGHHGSVHEVMYSTTVLPGSNLRPDFMRILKDSSCIHLHLVEIEDPKKPLFTKAGEMSASYKQARKQLTDWQRWFADTSNRAKLLRIVGLDADYNHFDMRLHRILLYGRRDAIANSPRGNESRIDEADGVVTMSYDHLSPKEDARQDVTVELRDGRQIVKYVPPTFGLGPQMMDLLDRLEGWDGAIADSDAVSDARKRFLLRRIPYWREVERTTTGTAPIVEVGGDDDDYE